MVSLPGRLDTETEREILWENSGEELGIQDILEGGGEMLGALGKEWALLVYLLPCSWQGGCEIWRERRGNVAELHFSPAIM